MARRDEVPTSAGIAEVQVGAEDAGDIIQCNFRILDMNVKDAVGEAVDEL